MKGAWVGGLVPVTEGRWARPEAFDAKKGCLVILVGVRSRNHMKGWEQEQQEKRMLAFTIDVVRGMRLTGGCDERATTMEEKEGEKSGFGEGKVDLEKEEKEVDGYYIKKREKCV
ncbi:hypothetical protein Tco_1247698 [Tanacetum coccineum]